MPQLVVDDARRAMAAAAAEFFGTPLRSSRSQGSPARTARRRPRICSTRSSSGGPKARAARDGRDARRGRAPRSCAHDRRGDRPPADVPRDARRRDRSCALEATSHGSELRPPRRRSLRGARVHEPHAGPPRLPRHDGALLRGEAPAVRADVPAAVNVGDEYGRRLAAELSAGGSRSASTEGRRSSLGPARWTVSTSSCAGGSTSRTRSPRSPRRGCSGSTTPRTRGPRVRPRRPGTFRRGRRRPAIHSAGRLRPHARRARERAAHGA